jgi:hypothetical protein
MKNFEELIQEFINKFTGDVMARGLMERELSALLAAYDQSKWKPYPENKPEDNIERLVEGEFGFRIAFFEHRKWICDLLNTEIVGVNRYCELPKPFKNK